MYSPETRTYVTNTVVFYYQHLSDITAAEWKACGILLLLHAVIIIIIIITELLVRLLAYMKNIGALQSHKSLRAKN